MFKQTKWLFFAVVLVLATACVTNKKHLLFQKNDLAQQYPIDTAVRIYQLQPFDYKVQTNDIISVRYQSLTQKEFDFLSQQTQQGAGAMSGGGGYIGGALLLGELVDDHGEIPVPVVGKVRVAGLTVFQIQDTLQKIVKVYLEAPIVKVRLLNYRITVLGEVQREGQVMLNNNRVSLPEALGLAGGINDYADRSKVKILRQVGSKMEVYYVNLLSEDFVKSPYYYVHQNDVIIVPPLKQRPYRMYFGQNLALVLSAVSIVLLVITLNRR
ncbi:MAG: polysaccharide biosynthesis/export family protein [Bacteroidetes bacterium]|nr:polysaccharide biosynthesis/export family protein [Bacteroidota bacterium]MBS1539748.1 polysaccharide biosynthesis/export family protein [Bacteroidota bacterium]